VTSISSKISIQRDGSEVVGTYRVDGGIVTVIYGDFTERTQLGSVPADVLARTILGELYLKAKSAA